MAKPEWHLLKAPFWTGPTPPYGHPSKEGTSRKLLNFNKFPSWEGSAKRGVGRSDAAG